MSPKRSDSAEEILKDKTGDIAKLRKMGITDFAIITYIVRVQDGLSRQEALRGLLEGRSLSPQQVESVRTVLERIEIR